MLDVLDLKIIREFCKLKKDEESSTWKIMKKIFAQGWNSENSLIKLRIKKMSEKNIFKIKESKHSTTYLLNDSFVSYKNFKFPDGDRKGIAVFLDGKWIIFSV